MDLVLVRIGREDYGRRIALRVALLGFTAALAWRAIGGRTEPRALVLEAGWGERVWWSRVKEFPVKQG